MVLFDTQGIPKFLITLFLLSPQLCFIIGFIRDLFVASNASRMSYKTSTWNKKCVLTSMTTGSFIDCKLQKCTVSNQITPFR